MNQNNNIQQEQFFLSAPAILRFLITEDEKLDTLIMCRSNSIKLLTSDQCLYEALGSVKDYDSFNQKKLVKLLEVTEIVSSERQLKRRRQILRHEAVDDIRDLALKNKGDEKNG